MVVIYRLRDREFEWNESKARSNRTKHGVSFEEAAEVFFDPLYQLQDASTAAEQRDAIIGYSITQHLLLVIHVERGTRTRIISARQATAHEREFYEDG